MCVWEQGKMVAKEIEIYLRKTMSGIQELYKTSLVVSY